MTTDRDLWDWLSDMSPDDLEMQQWLWEQTDEGFAMLMWHKYRRLAETVRPRVLN